MEEMQKEIMKFAAQYGFSIIGALIILVAGFLVARWVGRIADQWLSIREIEPPIRMLAVRLLRLLVFALSAVLALEKCGVPIAPMVAGIGVVGVGVGLALQGVLSNLVAGLLIIFTKPFRVGQYIELLGVHGQVVTIELFSTTLTHADQSKVVIPNRKIVGEILHNYGVIRQVDLCVGISYDSNVDEALSIVRDILANNPRVLKEPAPVVGLCELGESSVDVAIKPWTSVADFGPAAAEINQAVLAKFRERGIEMPFPQREIRVLNSPQTGTAVGVGRSSTDVRKL